MPKIITVVWKRTIREIEREKFRTSLAERELREQGYREVFRRDDPDPEVQRRIERVEMHFLDDITDYREHRYVGRMPFCEQCGECRCEVWHVRPTVKVVIR